MEHRKDIRSSPRKSKKSYKSTHLDKGSIVTLPVNTKRRIIRERRSRKTGCCHNTERCKGIGAVLIVLGTLVSIAGTILTVVAATDDDNKESKYPDSFLAVGPILLVLAVIFFFTGICLYSSYVTDAVHQCFSLDEPTSFCRVHCKKLSQCLKPDEAIARNQIAMKALQTEPGKSVLKRAKLPSVTSEDNGGIEYSIAAGTLDERGGLPHHLTKGVRFSDSDIDDDHSKNRRNSSDSGGSILSLRHCKIVPKNETQKIWWTDEVTIQESVFEPKGDMTTEL